MEVNFKKVGIRYRKLIKNVYNEAVKFTHNDMDNTSITVSFVNAKQIHELNKEYRNVDRATDVLSFPMLDIVYPHKVKEFKKEVSPDGCLYLGDVVICTEVAKKQAKEYGHKKEREFAFLALHGLLHVLGYDHIKADDEKIMSETCNTILDKLQIKRKNNV